MTAEPTRSAASDKRASMSLLTAMFTLTAFVLMWIGSFRCNFIKFVDISGSSSPITREFGLWYYQYWATIYSVDGTYIVQTCTMYPSSFAPDASWKAARAFSVLAFIFSIFIIIVRSSMSCSLEPENFKSGGRLAPLFLITALFQGLTLLFLDSKVCKNNELVSEGTLVAYPDTCSLSTGGNIIISATVFWAAAAFTSFVEHTAWQEERKESEPASLTEPLTS